MDWTVGQWTLLLLFNEILRIPTIFPFTRTVPDLRSLQQEVSGLIKWAQLTKVIFWDAVQGSLFIYLFLQSIGICMYNHIFFCKIRIFLVMWVSQQSQLGVVNTTGLAHFVRFRNIHLSSCTAATLSIYPPSSFMSPLCLLSMLSVCINRSDVHMVFVGESKKVCPLSLQLD